MPQSSKIVFKILLLLLLSMIIAYIIHFRVMAIEDLKQYNVTRNAETLNKIFIRNVWDEKSEIVDAIATKPLNVLYTDPEFISFAHKALDFFADLPVSTINIYNNKAERFLSTSRTNVSKNSPSSSFLKTIGNKFNEFLFTTNENRFGLNIASGGGKYSQILTNASFQLQDGTNQAERQVIQIFLPIIATKDLSSRRVSGIIEIYYDISEEWQDLVLFQNISIVGITVIFFASWLILLYTSMTAQKLIYKQYESNLELAEAKAKAEADSDNKSKFLANISHELRTPLNAIIGFSEIIKSETLGPVGHEQYKEYISDINNSGTHLLSLINDILDYSKAEADKLQVDSIEVDVAKILSTSLRLVQPRAEEAGVSLVKEISKEPQVILADPKRLKQAVLNLLSNSVKFTPEGGSVTLSSFIDHQKNLLIIQVKDTGIGIAQQDIAKAMSSFGQVDSKLSRKYEGTGLGLPLTKKLVELMGGKFQLESEQGLGTTSTLTFPYNPDLFQAPEVSA
jgi:two-component system cell cycle sensor histidine kinase PleC